MSAPITVSPDWIQQHAQFAAWLLGACGVVLVSVGSYFSNKLFTAINTALSDIKEIKDVQTVQAENHLFTIQTATLATRDETIKTNAKLDTLIEVMQRSQRL